MLVNTFNKKSSKDVKSRNKNKIERDPIKEPANNLFKEACLLSKRPTTIKRRKSNKKFNIKMRSKYTFI